MKEISGVLTQAAALASFSLSFLLPSLALCPLHAAKGRIIQFGGVHYKFCHLCALICPPPSSSSSFLLSLILLLFFAAGGIISAIDSQQSHHHHHHNNSHRQQHSTSASSRRRTLPKKPTTTTGKRFQIPKIRVESESKEFNSEKQSLKFVFMDIVQILWNVFLEIVGLVYLVYCRHEWAAGFWEIITRNLANADLWILRKE